MRAFRKRCSEPMCLVPQVRILAVISSSSRDNVGARFERIWLLLRGISRGIQLLGCALADMKGVRLVENLQARRSRRLHDKVCRHLRRRHR